MSLEPGVRLGPHEIVAPIGAGGMGEVYRARDTRLDRTVAIKVLAAHRIADPQMRPRFDREARAAASRTPALPLDEVFRHAIQIAEALAEAHRHGIVHRDLKPGNVILTKTGVKLLDFGLAKLQPSRCAPRSSTCSTTRT